MARQKAIPLVEKNSKVLGMSLNGALNVWKLSFLLGSLGRGFEIGPWEFCPPACA